MAPELEQRVAAFDIAAATKQTLPAKPAESPQVSLERRIQLLRLESTVRVPPTAGGSGTGTGCAMTATVARAVTDSPEAMAELAALPASVRTEADAVMLWNGGWMPAETKIILPFVSPSDPMKALKDVVVDALRGSPAECQNVETAGPQLIPIVEPDRTTMLVVGSGVWRWASLIDSVDEAQAARPPLQVGNLWAPAWPFTGN